MSRLLRSQPPQPDLRPPAVINGRAPVVTTIQVNLATGLLTNSRRVQERRTTTFLLKPQVIGPLPDQQQTTVSVTPAAGLYTNQRRVQLRRAKSYLSLPTVLAGPPLVTNIAVTSFAARERLNSNARRFPLQGWAQDGTSTGASYTEVAASPTDSEPNAPSVSLNNPLRFVAQRFTTIDALADVTAKILVAQSGTPTDTLVCSVYTDNAGQPGTSLGSGVVAGITSNFTLCTASILVALAPRTSYWLVWGRSGPTDVTNFYRPGQSGVNQHGGLFSGNGGGSWSTTGSVLARLEGTARPTILMQRRFLGPRPPLAVLPLPSPTIDVTPPNVAVSTRTAAPRRKPDYFLGGPTVLAQPPPVGYAIFVTFTHARPRRVHSSLPLVIVTTAAAPVETTVRTHTVRRVSRFSFIPALGHPVATVSELLEQTIRVTLARTRPPRVVAKFPTAIVAASSAPVETVISVTLAHTRPRPTRKTLAPPVVVRVPQVEQREDTITVALVRTRPRATVHALGHPQALSVFQAGVPTLARIRPRKTRTLLAPPTLVRVPSVEQVEDTVRVTLARIRPRPTAKRLAAPTVLQTFGGPQVTLVHTRPRPTRRFLAVPTALQTFSGPAVHLTRIRPRHVVALLGQPQALQTFQGPRVTTVHTRPRPTARFFTEAVVVRVPSVEQLEDTIRVSLVRARPRPTVKTLAAPTALQTFQAGKPTLARIRPRPTVKTLGEPTVLRVPSVEQAEQTIRVQAVRIRPRPTTRYLSPPRVITINPPVVTEITTELVEPRNRRDWPRRFPNQGQRQRLVRETGTTATYQQRDPFIGPRPPQIIDPLPTQRVETITVALVAARTRREIPRHTVEHFLRIPTRVIPLPTQQMQTVEAVYLQAVRRRTTDVRRLPHSTLRPPTQVSRTPVVTEITVLGQALHASLDRIPRRPRSFTVEPTVYAQSGEITVALVRARPRQTISRLTAVSYPQTSEIAVTLVHTRPRPQRALLKPPTVVRIPSVEQGEDTVRVALVRVRPRPTVKSLRPPAALQVFTGPQTHLVRIRPRPQRAVLTPPTRLRTFAGPVEAEITVSLVTARPRRLPHSRLTLPTAVLSYIFPPPLQRLTPGRRPAVHVRLSPPTVLRVEPPVDVHATVVLVAAKTRQRYRVGRWTLPEILPPPHAALLPKTTGYAVPGGFSDGDAIATATSDGDARAVSAAEGWVAPVAESDGKAVPDATTDGGVL